METNKKIHVNLDVMKTLLTIVMVFTHVLQFSRNCLDYSIVAKRISTFGHITTFSSFVFIFGCTTYVAYLKYDFKDVWKKMLVTSLKTLFAFYISGVWFRTFIDQRPIKDTVFDIILLKDIPGVSEFLISFSLYSLFALVFFNVIKKLLENKVLFWTVTGLFYLTTFMPYKLIKITQLGLLIGGYSFYYFPIAQYMPLFLIGIYLMRYEITWNIKFFFGSLLLTVIAVVGLIHGDPMFFEKDFWPERFPPTLFWIFLSSFLTYGYFLLSTYIAKLAGNRFKRLFSIGRNTLFYLLVSNITIFTITGIHSAVLILEVYQAVIATVILLLGTYFLTKIVK